MEVHLRNSRKSKDFKDLRSYLSSITPTNICSEFSKFCTKDDGPLLSQILFQGLVDNKTRLQVTETLLSLIQDGKLSCQRSEKLLSVLLGELDTLTVLQQVKLVDISVELFQKRSISEIYPFWKDLLPKLLNLISECDLVEDGGNRMTGNEYKSEIISTLCMSNWSQHPVASIAALFIELTLSKDEHIKVVNKLCSCVCKLNHEEIPSLTHQLLQLTKTQNSIIVFVTLQQYFNKNLYKNKTNSSEPDSEEDRFQKEIRSVESTVLYYIQSAASNFGPQAVRDLIKVMRETVNSPEFILDQFFMTVLLTVAGVSSAFDADVMSLLKSAIQRCIHEGEKIKNSAWMEEVVSFSFNIDEFVKHLVRNSCRERDVMLKGLVNVGFALLSTTRNKFNKDLSHTTDKMWKLGIYILSQLVRRYNCVTSTVLQTLTNNISQQHDSSQYAVCLVTLCKCSPLNILNNSSMLIQLMNNICCHKLVVAGCVAHEIITGVIPLTKMSPNLRDNFIMILRKSLFPKETAAFGFVEMLRDLKITNLTTLSQSISQNYTAGLTQMWSQGATSTRNNHTTGSAPAGAGYSNEGLCLELLSILREVFKQQYQVKWTFYKGIYNAVCYNRELSNHVLDNLHSQLDKYYVAGDDLPPVKFDQLVTIQGTNVVCHEPIALLILTTALVVVKTEECEDGPSYVKLQDMLGSMCERMAQCDVVHFNLELENGLNILDTDPECEVKQETLRQILSVYESLLGYVVCSWSRTKPDKSQVFLSLFKSYTRLVDFAKNLGKLERKKNNREGDKKGEKQGKKEKTNKHSSFKFPNTVLNFKCVSRLVSVLNNETVSWAEERHTNQLKCKREIHRYVLKCNIQLLNESQMMEENELGRIHSVFGYVCQIGRTLYTRCIKRLSELCEFDLQTTLHALECFQELVQLVVTKFHHKLSSFLADISGEGVENGLRKQLKVIIDVLLDQLDERLASVEAEDEPDHEDDEQLTNKITITLLSVITTLSNQLHRGSVHLQELVARVRKQCRERKTEHPQVSKLMLNLLLVLYVRGTPYGSLMHEIALCLCGSMKLIDEDMELEEHVEYGIINERTANVCLVVLCDHLRVLINEIDWTVARLRAILQTISYPCELTFEERRESLKEKEKLLCYHVNFTVKVLSTVCAIAVPTGVYSDSVLKELGNIYNKLTCLTKYFLTKVVKYKLEFQSSRFEKTVKLVDSELTKNMYCFTDHVIADGTAASMETNKKNKINPTLLKNRVMKETKIIPKIVFEKEQFQKFILQLSNKSKVDLVSRTKHALARDYRLYSKQVRDILEKENMQVEEEESVVDESTEDGSQNKRKKTQE